MLPLILLLLIALFGIEAGAATPIHLWSQRFGDAADQGCLSIATDPSGNVYVAGYFLGSIDFGAGALSSDGGTDICLAKFSDAGIHIWSKRFGDISGGQEGYAVTTDASGNVYLTGYFQGSADFGGGVLTSAGDYDVFLVKFDGSGVHQWSKRFGDATLQYGTSVATDALGNVYLSGMFYGDVDFGGGTLTSAGLFDAFVAKFDSVGSHLWSKRFGDGGYQWAFRTCTDPANNVCVAGLFTGSVDLGGGPLVGAGNYDIFLAKLDPSGAHLWSKRFGDASGQYVYSIATDAGANVYIAGPSYGAVDFGGGLLMSAGDRDLFLAKFDASGAHQWSKRFGDAGGHGGCAVTTDVSGNVYLSSDFSGGIDFGGGVLTSAGFYDLAIAKFTAAGAHEWSERIGDSNNQYAFAAACGNSGTLYVAGYFEGSMSFGSTSLVSAGGNDMYLAKLGDEGPVPVLINHFEATPREHGVELTWELSGDETLDHFTLYRWYGQLSRVAIATGDAQTTSSYLDESVEPGAMYQYELVVRTRSGEEFRSLVATATLPRVVTTLEQNAPNPFNPQTTIAYTVSVRAHISIEIFDASGARVRVLDQDVREAGSYRVDWDGRDAANRQVGSGVYFYRLSGVNGSETRKMVLLK